MGVWSDCLSGVLASRNLAVEQTRDRGGAAPRWCGVNQTPIQPRPDRSVLAGRPTDTLEERRLRLTLEERAHDTHDFVSRAR